MAMLVYRRVSHHFWVKHHDGSQKPKSGSVLESVARTRSILLVMSRAPVWFRKSPRWFQPQKQPVAPNNPPFPDRREGTYCPGTWNIHELNGCFNWMMNQIFTWKMVVSPFPSIKQKGCLEFQGIAFFKHDPFRSWLKIFPNAKGIST